jgi:4-hydroxybenzoate polyprenyltransferase
MQHGERPGRPPPLPGQVVVTPKIIRGPGGHGHLKSVTRIIRTGQTHHVSQTPPAPVRALPALIRASHPEPALAVTAVAALLAVAVGHHASGVLAVAAAVLATQLSVSWVNDWLDADRDAAVGRTDKPIPTGAISRRAVGIAALVATVAAVPLALLSGPVAGGVILLALVSALLYDWPLKFTPLSVLPYLISFAAMPAFVVLALPGTPTPPVWLLVTGGLLGGGAHFANVLPDLSDDVRTGVRGLPHRIGPAWSRAAAAILLLGATATLTLGPPGPPSPSSLAALALALAVLVVGYFLSRAAIARGDRPVAAFRAVMLVALIDVVLLLATGRVV